MKLQILLRRRALFVGLAAAGLVLQACASGPRPHPAVPAIVAPPAPKPAKMAPIPNPPDEQKSPEPTVAAPPPRPAKPAAPRASRTPARPPAAAGVTAANAARAAKLRATGLEQLDRGAVDRAVSLLQQASQLDPSNELVQHDLERARRISQVVHAKP